MSAMIEGTSAGPTGLRRGFLAVPEAVRQGRLIVEAQVLQWGLPQVTLEDAVLVVSEMLTNAVHATPGLPITLRLALFPGGLRVEVWDSSSARPEASVPDLVMPTCHVPDDEPDPGGWGLSIIARLAKAHGCRGERGGKCVWAVLPTVR